MTLDASEGVASRRKSRRRRRLDLELHRDHLGHRTPRSLEPPHRRADWTPTPIPGDDFEVQPQQVVVTE